MKTEILTGEVEMIWRPPLRSQKETVQSGMDFMLDFHYSDFWVDPAKTGKNRKPGKN